MIKFPYLYPRQRQKDERMKLFSLTFYWLAGFPHCIDCLLCIKTATCGPFHFVGVVWGSIKHKQTFFLFIVDYLMQKIDQKVTEIFFFMDLATSHNHQGH